MPRPARYDHLPRLTDSIKWTSLGSRADGADATAWDLTPQAAGDSGLPSLNTDGLPLPISIHTPSPGESGIAPGFETQEPTTAAGPLQYSGDGTQDGTHGQRSGNTSQAGQPFVPFHDGQSKDRMQHCLHALEYAGFPSVEAFALEFFSSRLGMTPVSLTPEQQTRSSTLEYLVVVLQKLSLQLEPPQAASLQNGIAEAAKELYLAELRNLDSPYDPQRAEYQVSSPCAR